MVGRKFRLNIIFLLLILFVSVVQLANSMQLNALNLTLIYSQLSTPLTDPQNPCPRVNAQVPTPHFLLQHRSSKTVMRSLARWYCFQGDLPAAQAEWQRLYAFSPYDFSAAYYLALTSYALNHPVHTRFDSQISTYASRRGHLFQNQKDMDTAVSWYRFALWIYPDIFTASHLSHIYRTQKKLEEAIAVWNNVIARLSPNSWQYWWAVAQRADMENAWEEAARAYLEAARRAPPQQAYTYYITAGDRWTRVKAYDRAEFAYYQALNLQPKQLNAYLRLGNLARYQNAFDSALHWYKQAQKLAPNHYLPFYYIGMTEWAQRHYRAALRYFNMAIKKNPKAPSTWYRKAITLEALGHRREALKALNRAITLHPAPPKDWLKLQAHWQKYPDQKQDPQYWWNRGRQQEQKRLWRTALDFYHYGVQFAIPPDDYPLLMREALMWRYLGHPDKAKAIYRDLVVRYPDRMEAYIGLGDLARDRGAWDEAIDWYKQAWRVAPKHYAPPYHLGVTAYYAKRYQEALEYLERSLALNPKAAWAWYYKAITLKALGRDDEASIALQKALSLYEKPPPQWIKGLTR